MCTEATSPTFELRIPNIADGAQIHRLVDECKPLDMNSLYAYLLVAHHFSETSVVAERDARILGFISGYCPPATFNTLFIWQVAVHPDARRHGLATKMLKHILSREQMATANYLETTVTPSNQASARLFRMLARDLGAKCTETPLFENNIFGSEAHETEVLFRIGPFNR